MITPLIAIPTAGVARIAGLVVSAGILATLVAITYRWYTQERVPEGLAILTGLAAVAVYFNTTTALGQVIGGTQGLFDLESALVNTGVFIFGGVSALAGRHIGDRLAQELNPMSGVKDLDTELGQLVRSVGRVITVTIPPAMEIENIEGYDPVPDTTKEQISGKTLVFPRRLTLAELRDRLITRLKEDYAIGHVGVELADDGSVEYLGLGSRASGIGPTLAPGTAATTIQADPGYAASSGDLVQIWRTEPERERISTAELRARVDDYVTVALDEPDALALNPSDRYRLLTLPTDVSVDREFAALLRHADETMGVVELTDASALVGAPVGAIEPTVIAIRPVEGTVEALPKRQRILKPGDTVYVIARPEILRRLEATVVESGRAEPSS